MRPWIEPKPAGTAVFKVEWINVLKMFAFIYRQGRADVEGGILEAGAILQSSDIATEHARPASVQTANEDILAVAFIVLQHKCYRFRLGDETTSALPLLKGLFWRACLILVRANSGNIAWI